MTSLKQSQEKAKETISKHKEVLKVEDIYVETEKNTTVKYDGQQYLEKVVDQIIKQVYEDVVHEVEGMPTYNNDFDPIKGGLIKKADLLNKLKSE